MENVQATINELNRVKSLLIALDVAAQELQKEWDNNDGDIAEMLNNAYPFHKDFADMVIDINNWRDAIIYNIDEDLSDLNEKLTAFYIPLVMIRQTVGWDKFVEVTGVPDSSENEYEDDHIFIIKVADARKLGFPIK